MPHGAGTTARSTRQSVNRVVGLTFTVKRSLAGLLDPAEGEETSLSGCIRIERLAVSVGS